MAQAVHQQPQQPARLLARRRPARRAPIARRRPRRRRRRAACRVLGARREQRPRSPRRSAPRVSAKRSEPAGDHRLQRAASSRSWPSSRRRSGPSTRASATSGGVLGEQLVGRLAQVRRPRCGRRPRPARRAWGSGGRACRSRRPRAWRRLQRDVGAARRRTARSPRSSSFSRLRTASARWAWSWHGKRRVPPVACYIGSNRRIPPLRCLGGRTQMSKVWFITGTSKGFGRVWAEAALERGDRVAATARNADTLDAARRAPTATTCSPLALDVTDKAAVDAAVQQAHEHFGRLDVVVNNAGYGLFGTIEEVSEEQARAQIETNLFGALWVTQAALPILREQGSGHIIQVSSIGGVNAFPIARPLPRLQVGPGGLQPVAGGRGRRFGIKVTIVEPTGYSTDWAGPSSVTRRRRCRAYDAVREARAKRRTARAPSRATRRPPARRSSSSSTPTSRRCACSSATGTLEMIQRRVRAALDELGAVGPALAVAAQGRGEHAHEHRSASSPPPPRSSRASTCPASARSSPAARPGSASRPPARWPSAGAEVTLAVRDVDGGRAASRPRPARRRRRATSTSPSLESVEAFAAAGTARCTSSSTTPA